jgi:hypothetical protein
VKFFSCVATPSVAASVGSGSSLIAAENTGRACSGIELDQLCVDVINRRYEAETGVAAILADSGETFEKVAARRRNEESDDYSLRDLLRLTRVRRCVPKTWAIV